MSDEKKRWIVSVKPVVEISSDCYSIDELDEREDAFMAYRDGLLGAFNNALTKIADLGIDGDFPYDVALTLSVDIRQEMPIDVN